MLLRRDRSTWDPFRELEAMSNHLNRLFGAPLAKAGDEQLRRFDFTPACNISETEDRYEVTAELPEIRREDVHVTTEDGVLTIQGERKAEREEKSKKFHRVESSYGSFLRRFQLPDNADETRVEALFKDGMLTVRIPKTVEQAPKARKITIS
jgi:HSP20 family protein